MVFGSCLSLCNHETDSTENTITNSLTFESRGYSSDRVKNAILLLLFTAIS
jgi:hypothetical protein